MTKNTRNTLNRRGFMAGAAAVSVPLVVPAAVTGKNPPSDRVRMGFIGMGGQGIGRNMGTFLHQKDALVTAVCDVQKQQRRRAKQRVDGRYKNKDCRVFTDFREVLALKDIDAVCISTPDHWHVPLSLAALEAGYDVMSEKPTLTVAEGRRLVGAVGKHEAVFQWGIEDRSVLKYHKMAEWALNGALGTLKTVRVTLPNGKKLPKEKPVPVPEGMDWNLWLGPAPFVPYTPTRTRPMHWREIFDYSGGMITDWGAHLVDTAQVGAGVDTTGPVEVEAAGTIPADAMTDVPVRFDVRCRYANGVEIQYKSGGTGIRFEGTDGWVQCDKWRGRITASSDDILRTKYTPAESKLWPCPPEEQRNFLDCIKSRKKTTYHAEAGHRLFTPLHLGHIAIRVGRTLKWDPAKEEIVGDAEAAKYLDRPARDWEKA